MVAPGSVLALDHARPVDFALGVPPAGTLGHALVGGLISESAGQAKSGIGGRAGVGAQLGPVIFEVVESGAGGSAPAVVQHILAEVAVGTDTQTPFGFVAISVGVDGCLRAVKHACFGCILGVHTRRTTAGHHAGVGLVLGVGENRSDGANSHTEVQLVIRK